jgi:hypothetical protein
MKELVDFLTMTERLPRHDASDPHERRLAELIFPKPIPLACQLAAWISQNHRLPMRNFSDDEEDALAQFLQINGKRQQS